ncbi:hypothetical protein [Mucilaginibacter sp.]|uniref:hypothetical protein n=1 Tax=Mucilaginibacter sp. TaxID=1882438 RepID=UPI002637AF77|nr:hypothetical protein [Mucilaginibacter sp.]
MSTITGKWYKVSSILTNSTTEKNSNTSTTSTNAVTTYFNHTDYIVFNNDGTGEQLKGGSRSTFNYTKNGNVLTLTYPANNEQSASVSVAAIKYLSENSFQFAINYTTTNSDGVTTYNTYDISYVR